MSSKTSVARPTSPPPPELDVLYVATKSPWPPIDGGRVLMLETLRALRSTNVRVTLVAPGSSRVNASPDLSSCCELHLVEATGQPRALLSALGRRLLRRQPWPIARHSSPALRAKVAHLLSRRRFDVVHVEQLQALRLVPRIASARPPVVLRMQNVESHLWQQLARVSRSPLALALAFEARQIKRFEAKALNEVNAVVALTEDDELRLRQLGGDEAPIHRIAAPFPVELPMATRRFWGDPAVVLFSGADWRPNRDAAKWFAGSVWPSIVRSLPGARLHLIGFRGQLDREDPTILSKTELRSSVEAFADGAILVVPLRVASGVRIKILEAWARGVPVVGSPAAVRGLQQVASLAVEVATSGEDYVKAITRLVEPAARNRLVAAGRATLANHHDPTLIAERLLACYRTAMQASSD